MLKLLLVDDEPIILECLATLVEWESVGVRVIGVADNGSAALDLSYKIKPDIIISDISMPCLNGIEMLETLRKNDVNSEIIFISAYGKFEYAQQAIKFGAFDYILKPIQETQLLETVRRCADAIRLKRDRQALSAAEGGEFRRELVLRLILENRAPLPQERAALAEYGDGGGEGLGQGQGQEEGLGKEEEQEEEQEQEQGQEQVQGVKHAHEQEQERGHGRGQGTRYEQEQEHNRACIMLLGRDLSEDARRHAASICKRAGIRSIMRLGDVEGVETALLLNEPEDDASFSRLRELSLELSSELEPYGMALSSVLPYPEGVARGFCLLCLRLLASEFDDGRPAHSSKTQDDAEPAAQSLRQAGERLRRQVWAGGEEGVSRAIYDMLRAWSRDGEPYDLHGVKLALIDIAGSVLSELYARQPGSLVADNDKRRALRKELAAQTNVLGVYFAAERLFSALAKEIGAIERHTTARLVRQAVRYIQANFKNELTLAAVAGHLYISPAYLSKIFSAEMRQTFSSYLQTLRIEHAKTLLWQSNMKIYEIAVVSGYGDVPHFSKLFKQATGMSPNEYRKQG